MPIVLLAPIIGAIALCVAHFEQPRERLIAWARECGEAFDPLTSSHCETLRGQKEPPFRYGLRAYLLFELIGDLDQLESYGKSGKWEFSSYVEPRIVAHVAAGISAAMRYWSGPPARELPGEKLVPDEVYEAVSHGFQRIGMFQEQVLSYERRPWIATVLWRVRINRQIERRRRQRRQERAENLEETWITRDLRVPL